MEVEIKSNYPLHIKEQQIRNKKYFIYRDKEYPVDFDLLKKNSDYFFKFQNEFTNTTNINLIDKEEENDLKFSEDCIRVFISCCHNEECMISKSSVIGLQYLARKYEFQALLKATSKIISEHWTDLLFSSLLFKNYNEQTKIIHFSNHQKKNNLFHHT